ncbi:MAG: DNA repair protein RecN [Chloroflexota bacterium]
MLKNLYIKNFAIIDEQEIEFSPELNIITGETGAGKSIMVDALMVALGERSSADFIRRGESKAVIEAKFEIEPNHPAKALIRESEVDEFGSELIIRREILSGGSSRGFINDSPVRAGLLRQFGDLLVDFHGQHEHQSLLRPERHVALLDAAFGSYAPILDDYKAAREELAREIAALRKLTSEKYTFREKYEYKRLQLEEIEKIAPQPNEEEEIEGELKILMNSERLFSLAGEAASLLSGDDNSATTRLARAKKLIEELSGYDPSFSQYVPELEAALISASESASFASHYTDRIKFDPARIESLRARQLQLRSLLKKYGTLEDAIKVKNEIRDYLEIVNNADEKIAEMTVRIHELQRRLGELGGNLLHEREKASLELSTKVEDLLRDMAIAHPRFSVRFTGNEIEDGADERVAAEVGSKLFEAYPHGLEKIEFLISTNKGEDPKPLAQVASGGEISRVMLSIKSITSAGESLPILICDEIDSGISGRVAARVGRVMKRLSKKHQIIAITHLPQIAAFGERNFSVEKSESNGRTVTKAILIEGEKKMLEIAKMFSGDEVSAAGLESAGELLREAKNI